MICQKCGEEYNTKRLPPAKSDGRAVGVDNLGVGTVVVDGYGTIRIGTIEVREAYLLGIGRVWTVRELDGLQGRFFLNHSQAKIFAEDRQRVFETDKSPAGGKP